MSLRSRWAANRIMVGRQNLKQAFGYKLSDFKIWKELIKSKLCVGKKFACLLNSITTALCCPLVND